MLSSNNFFNKGFLNAVLQVKDTQVEWTPPSTYQLLYNNDMTFDCHVSM